MKLDWEYRPFLGKCNIIEFEQEPDFVIVKNGSINNVVYELCNIVKRIPDILKNILNLQETNKQLSTDVYLLKDEVFRLKYPDLKSFVKDKEHVVWSSLDPIHREILCDYLKNEYNKKGIFFTLSYAVPMPPNTVNINGNRIVCIQQIIDECEKIVNNNKSSKKGGKNNGRKN